MTAKWCPRQDSNLRPQDSYHFDFRRRQSVRGLDCPFAVDPRVCRRCPSSLYTFPALPGLARDRLASMALAFPEFEQIHHGVSDRGAQFFPGILCSILLSYVDLASPYQ